MSKRRFEIEYSVYGMPLFDVAIIELDDAVIDVVDDDWRKQLYDLHTPEDIAKHVAYNLLENKIQLSQMDGWADQPNSNARVIQWPDYGFDMEAKEVTNDE